MMRAHRVPATRSILLIPSAMLCGATVIAFAASGYPSQAGAFSNMHTRASSRAFAGHATGKRSSSSRRIKCIAAARKHRKTSASCSIRRSRTHGTKPGVSHVAPRLGVPEATPSANGLPGGSVSTPSGPTTPSQPVLPAESPAPFRFFSPSSLWNQPVVASAPLDPHSTEVVGMLDAEIAAEEQAKDGPWINTTSYSVPVYTVPAHQQTVSVQLDHHTPDAALSSAWSAVPLPADAQPAAGTDAVLVVSQPSTDRLWEFWRLAHEADGWHASWGGAMQNVSSDAGVYGPDAWPGAKPWWGSSASSLSLVGGLISFEDLKRGEINHALSMSTPDVRAGVYASPAQRDDGQSTDPLSLPEGAHLRLNPNLNLASLHLPPLTLMIAEAAQRYGIFVRDRAQNVAFYAQDPISTPTNPYAPPGGYFEGKYPRELLASFPWSQLELLKMELHDGS
jgi:hypothetical protein